MAIAKNERPPVSWDDLLSAINPPPDPQEESVWQAIDEVATAWRDGHITHEEAATLIRMFMAANVGHDMRGMIDDAFSSNEEWRSESTPRRWRFLTD